MLGVVISMTELIKPESVRRALEVRVPEKFLNDNRKALYLGIEMADEYKQKTA